MIRDICKEGKEGQRRTVQAREEEKEKEREREGVHSKLKSRGRGGDGSFEWFKRITQCPPFLEIFVILGTYG